MKREQLNPGDEVYYADSKTWTEYDNGRKAVVVDAGYWERASKFNERRYRQVRPRTAGAGVLVKINPGTDREYTIVTPLMYLRGPYAETKALAAKTAADRQAASNAANQQREETILRAKTLVARADELGISASVVTINRSYNTIQMSLDVVERLLDAYALTHRTD